jgi:hypothetical protein
LCIFISRWLEQVLFRDYRPRGRSIREGWWMEWGKLEGFGSFY